MKNKEKIVKFLLLLIGLISIVQIIIRYIKGISSYGWIIPLESVCIEIGMVPWGMVCLLLGTALPFNKNNGKILLALGIIFSLITFGGVSTMVDLFSYSKSLIYSMFMVMPLLMLTLFAFDLYIIKTKKASKLAKVLLIVVGLLSLIYEIIFALTVGIHSVSSLIIMLIGILFGITCCFSVKRIAA